MIESSCKIEAFYANLNNSEFEHKKGCVKMAVKTGKFIMSATSPYEIFSMNSDTIDQQYEVEIHLTHIFGNFYLRYCQCDTKVQQAVALLPLYFTICNRDAPITATACRSNSLCSSWLNGFVTVKSFIV